MACHSAAAEALPSSTLARRVARRFVSCITARDSWISLTDVSVLCLSFLAVPRRAPRAASAPCQPSRVSVDRIRFSPFAGRGVPVGVARSPPPGAGALQNRSRSAQFDLCSSFRIAPRPHPLHAASGASSRAWRWPPQLYTRRAARGGSARHGTTQGTAPRTSGAPARAQPGRMQRTTIATLCKCRTKLSAVPSSARLFSLTQPERRGSRTARASGRRSTPWQRGKSPCPAPLPFASPQPAPGRLRRGRSRPRPPCRPSP